MGPFDLEVSSDTITGSVSDVPSGSGRRVSVTAFDSDALPVYAGSTVVDVNDNETTTARLTLARNWVDCPPDSSGAGGTGDIDIIGDLSNDATLTQLSFRVTDAESDLLSRLFSGR